MLSLDIIYFIEIAASYSQILQDEQQNLYSEGHNCCALI